MNQNKFGEIVLDENDICDLIMQGRDLNSLERATVSQEIDVEKIVQVLEDPSMLLTWTFPEASDIAVPDYHAAAQQRWHMPDQYQTMDIAAHVLELCQSQAELQRCGEELLLYQEHNLFNLLRYLRYLVDVMQENRVIWGIGRGSSVSSFVLYKLGVHRIDSLYYNLDIREFLR